MQAETDWKLWLRSHSESQTTLHETQEGNMADTCLLLLRSDPKEMTSTHWYDMFSNISSILNNIQQKIASVEDITEKLEVKEKQVVEIKEELTSQRFRLDLMANAMIRQEEIISSLGSKMLSMQSHSMRKTF